MFRRLLLISIAVPVMLIVIAFSTVIAAAVTALYLGVASWSELAEIISE